MAKTQATRICSIEGCEKRSRARGWCDMHYKRWQVKGDPLAVPFFYPGKPEESFAERTERDPSGCLLWTGALTDGYGYMSVHGAVKRVHRYAWERANGPIPEGMVVDHLCHNRACAEVAHLRVATAKQNAENRKGAMRGTTSGIRGVYWHSRDRKWVAQVKHDQVVYQGGSFDTKEEAGVVAAAMRAQFFTHSQN